MSRIPGCCVYAALRHSPLSSYLKYGQYFGRHTHVNILNTSLPGGSGLVNELRKYFTMHASLTVKYCVTKKLTMAWPIDLDNEGEDSDDDDSDQLENEPLESVVVADYGMVEQ
ncbi:uncharacterized protein PADG_11056 [Paracoccidioides brasiliensis Pb18]|uniref:Uncharacterized protein n=2 Tax=Paracoccidioides brasiliensis TaxID=121759 RepID=A0A0A0HVK4_PARBD|nr:uncharacterized protein PADG_11056 [Paracoccidioides brasiliensis Pb18]KGM92607.1 hypothetical protein PADG_11056 [Paracoccidioides brasiliensis Pb18]ODH47416.1 hypothetical protein GX48_06519 [Paracoccidioides brasiliensis]